MTEREKILATMRLRKMQATIKNAIDNIAYYKILSDGLENDTFELLNIDSNQVQNILQQMYQRVEVVSKCLQTNE